jgi:hypothetical protein
VRKGHLGPTRLSLCEDAVRALALALKRAEHQVTFRQIAAAWSEANPGTDASLPERHSWKLIFEPAVRQGRVVVTRVGFLPYYTLRDGPDYPLPERTPIALTSYRLEISAAAERALALALARAGRQVVWSEIQDAWCEANGSTEPLVGCDRPAWYVTEPARVAGRIVRTHYQHFTFYTLAAGPEYAIPSLRPTFTARRLQAAHAAERALGLALVRAGHQVTWREIRAAWEEANGAQCRYRSVGDWQRIIEPLIQAGRIRRTRQQEGRSRLLYFTLVDGPEYPLPAKPEFSEFRLAKCEAGVRALALALSFAGTQVQREQIRAAWLAANASSDPRFADPPPNMKHWDWIIAPAVRVDRVGVTLRAGQGFYTLADGRTYLLPPRLQSPRVFGPRLRMRMVRAENALSLAAGEMNRMVETAEIVGTWEHANSEPMDCSTDEVLQILWASAEMGRVHHERQNRHNYFAPLNRPDLTPPLFASDLHRIEEAVKRAATRMRSAVLFEEILREVESDPDLQPQGSVPISGILSTLTWWNRIQAFKHLGRRAGYLYYAPLASPKWVRAEAEHHLDRCYRAVLELWRASHGRPFTTRALRRFAASRPGLRIANDASYDWATVLRQFRRNGDLASIREENSHYHRWAPNAEWSALSSEERERRLHDQFGRNVDPDEPYAAAGTGLDTDATPYDVAHTSRARDLRILVLVAKAIRGASEDDPERRRILRARPVTLVHMREALHARPALRLGDRESLAAHVSDAVRIREYTRRPALTPVGVVGRRRFLDVRATPAGHAYVAYCIAAAGVKLRSARQRVRQLRQAFDLSDLKLVPLPQTVLHARADLLAAELRGRARALVSACRKAELLVEEHQRALADIGELRRLRRDVISLVSQPRPALIDAKVVERVGITAETATKQVTDLLPIQPRNNSAIVGWLGRTALRPADPETKRLQKAKKRRSVNWMVDRVGFACYSSVKWGGPLLASLGQQAWHAMGDLRTSDLFIAALQDPGATSVHAPCAAVLGFFDDGPSRGALVDYIHRSLAVRGRVAYGTTVIGVETAVLGLAPLPFGACATTLLPVEQAALWEVAQDGVDERIRTIATRVLRAWDENWSRHQLCVL